MAHVSLLFTALAFPCASMAWNDETRATIDAHKYATH
eukprot:CAMPEP_0185824602 /NCGR_PEP_ID=MMETSP1322-20130828/29874_1 /TAXON_ID=265543 /ORGANISM="Minutocellus polymorphus, Strain RCC2270" /LENGTH=36 /DNA_ID= /DNA_START= /DNA_END= /DNA_ORIENTATION=